MKNLSHARRAGVQFPTVDPDGLTGKRLASARKEARLSQRALAAELGVTLRTIQNYEAGKSVTYRHLDTLSRRLGCSPSWLLHGQEHHHLDQVLATSRQQRDQLEANLERLVELREQLHDSASQSLTRPDAPPALPEQ